MARASRFKTPSIPSAAPSPNRPYSALLPPKLPAESSSQAVTQGIILPARLRTLRSANSRGQGTRTLFSFMSPLKRSDFIRDCKLVGDDVGKLLKLGWGMYSEDLGQLKRAHAHAMMEYRLVLEEMGNEAVRLRSPEQVEKVRRAKAARGKKGVPRAIEMVKVVEAPTVVEEPTVVEAPTVEAIEVPTLETAAPETQAEPAGVEVVEVHSACAPSLRVEIPAAKSNTALRSSLNAHLMGKLKEQAAAEPSISQTDSRETDSVQVATVPAVPAESATSTTSAPRAIAPPTYYTPAVHQPNLSLKRTREEIHADIMGRLEKFHTRRELWLEEALTGGEGGKPEWKALMGLDRNSIEQLKLEATIHGMMENVATPTIIAVAVSSTAGNDKEALLQGREVRELSATGQLALRGIGLSRQAMEIRALGEDLRGGGDERRGVEPPKQLESASQPLFSASQPLFSSRQLAEEFPEDSLETQTIAKAVGKGRFLDTVDVNMVENGEETE